MKFLKGIISMVMAVLLLAVGIWVGLQLEIQRKGEQEELSEKARTTVAVVNLDMGYTLGDETHNYSEAIIQNLLLNDYVVVSASTAQSGYNNGIYGAVLTFPKDLSESLVTINTKTPTQTKLEFVINPNLQEDLYINLHTQLINLQSEINKTLATVYVTSIFNELHSAQNQGSALLENDFIDMAALELVKLDNFTQTLKLGDIPEEEFEPDEAEYNKFVEEASVYGDNIAKEYIDSYTVAQQDFDIIEQKLKQEVENINATQNEYIENIEKWALTVNTYKAEMNTHQDELEAWEKDVINWGNFISNWHVDLGNFYDNLTDYYERLTLWKQKLSDYKLAQDEYVIDIGTYKTEIGDYLSAGVDYFNESLDEINSSIDSTVLIIQKAKDNETKAMDYSNQIKADVAAAQTAIDSYNLVAGDLNIYSQNYNQWLAEYNDWETAYSDWQTECTTWQTDNEDILQEWFDIGLIDEAIYDQYIEDGYISELNFTPPEIDTFAPTVSFEIVDIEMISTVILSNLLDIEEPSFEESEILEPLENITAYDGVVPVFTAALSPLIDQVGPAWDPEFTNPETPVKELPEIPVTPDYIKIEKVPDIPESLETQQKDFIATAESFNPLEYLNEETKKRADNSITNFSSYMEMVKSGVEANDSINLLKLSDIYSSYNSYVLELSSEAVSQNSQEQKALEERLGIFYDAKMSTSEANRWLIEDFTTRMPNSRIGGVINTSVVDATLTPIEFINIRPRNMQVTSDSSQQEQLLFFQKIIFIVLIALFWIIVIFVSIKILKRRQARYKHMS